MAIGTYSELQTAVGNWLNRADLSALIPDFIAMAEARMNRDSRLRVEDAVTRGTLEVTGQFTDLPAGFQRMVNAEVQVAPVRPLEYRSPQTMDAVRNGEATGIPRYYCVLGDELELAPAPDGAYTLGLIYYRNIPALSDSETSNWLLTAAPDVYLYATLAESAPFLMDDQRVALWEGIYNARVEAYRESSEADQVSGSPLIMTAINIG